MELKDLSKVPLGEFAARVKDVNYSTASLRSVIEILAHKISVEDYDLVVVLKDSEAWERLITRAQDEGGLSTIEGASRIATLAVVLIRKFGPRESSIFLSPSRVAARSYESIPLTLSEVSSKVPVRSLKERDIAELRLLRQVKNVIRPTVQVFRDAGVRDVQIEKWAQVEPLIP